MVQYQIITLTRQASLAAMISAQLNGFSCKCIIWQFVRFRFDQTDWTSSLESFSPAISLSWPLTSGTSGWSWSIGDIRYCDTWPCDNLSIHNKVDLCNLWQHGNIALCGNTNIALCGNTNIALCDSTNIAICDSTASFVPKLCGHSADQASFYLSPISLSQIK